MRYYRLICSQLLRAAGQFPILVLTGARHVGKTTLLRGLFPNHGYVSLNLPSVPDLAERDTGMRDAAAGACNSAHGVHAFAIDQEGAYLIA
jgi:hypothetical protein